MRPAQRMFPARSGAATKIHPFTMVPPQAAASLRALLLEAGGHSEVPAAPSGAGETAC